MAYDEIHTSEQAPSDFAPIDLQEDRRSDVLEKLQKCLHWWEAKDGFRLRRRRSRNYVRGNQWDEVITDPDNPDTQVSEKSIIQRQGRIPWVMNHIGAAIRNMKGQFRQNRSERNVFAVDRENNEATEQMNVALRGVRRFNKSGIIESDQFEEHLISGSSAWRIGIEYDSKLNRNEVKVHPVDQSRLFYNLDLQDRRMDDLRIVGELHDLTLDQIIVAFAHDENGVYNSTEAARIRTIYAEYQNFQYDHLADYGFDYVDSVDFWDTNDAGLNRVIEVWEERSEMVRFAHDTMTGDYSQYEGDDLDVATVNAEREVLGQPIVELTARYEPTWHCSFLSPFGDVLFESKSPYWHEGHPYVIGLATLLDGDTWGMVEQIIDPQRWLNRLVTSMDHSMSVAAKGVLMVPEDSVPDDMSINDFAETWSRANGVLKIKLKPGATAPTQIATNAIPGESWEMLQNLKTWIQETSGITGPMQGFNPSSGTPASLYQQQVQQASTTNLDYFETFMETLHEVDNKTVQVIAQAFDEPRNINETAGGGLVQYDPQTVREMSFSVGMGNVADTAVYRQLFETDLQTFLGEGHIDFGTYLEMSSHPKADALLKLLQRQQGGGLQGMDIGAMQQALSQGNGSVPQIPVA